MAQILLVSLFVACAFALVVFLLIKQVKKLKSESIYRETFADSVESQIYLKDEHLKYVFVNEEFCRFAGKQKNEIIGQDDSSILDEGLAKLRRETDLEVLEKKSLIQREGEWSGRIFRFAKFPVRMQNGKTGVGAYVRDITEESSNKKKVQKTLLRNNILLDVINRTFESTRLQLDYVLHEALKLTESRYGHVYLYDEGTEELVLNTWSRSVLEECGVANPETRLSLKDVGLWGEVIRQRRPIIENDFGARSPVKNGFPEGHVDIKKFMSVPVVIDEKVVAIVGVANKEEDYDENDVFQLSVLMIGVWNAKTRKEAQEKLVAERNGYLQTLISIGDGVMVVDREGRILMLNKAGERLTGWSAEDAVGKQHRDVFVVVSEDGAGASRDPVRDAFITTDTVRESRGHSILTSKNGDTYCVEDSAAPVWDEQNNMVGVVLVFHDVTEKKEQSQEIEYLSFHDPLTGLYNRRYFEEAMLCLDTKANLPVSIIMGDVNGLKLTNDVFGHTFGDMLLKKVSEVLQKAIRPDDIVARFGGDEFVLLLPKTGVEEAEELIKNVKALFELEQVKAIKGSISMGLDTKEEESDDLLHVLENAEERMYLEKALERKFARSSAINEIVQTLHENYPVEKMHALRVSALCYAFGRTQKLTDVELRKLRDAGFLHDIGKIVLESRILDHTKVLSGKEWGSVKRHPIIGFRILNAFDGTLDLAEPVLTHHERWDGTGYPKGLKGGEIPLIARMIALAESYDKIVSSSDKPMPEAHAAAIESIRRNAGTQFDPAMARAFLRFLEKPIRLDEESLESMQIRF